GFCPVPAELCPVHGGSCRFWRGDRSGGRTPGAIQAAHRPPAGWGGGPGRLRLAPGTPTARWARGVAPMERGPQAGTTTDEADSGADSSALTESDFSDPPTPPDDEDVVLDQVPNRDRLIADAVAMC